MFHHIRKISTIVKASPISVLYPQNNNKVMRVMDQTRFLHEESKKPAAAGTLLDQISLRPFELTDVDNIMLWATDEQLLRYCGWKEIGLKGMYTSKEDALEDLENNIIPHPWSRAICLKNQPIGKIFVDSCRGSYRFRADVTYFVASKHWGKGIATTAVKMVLDTVFKDLPHLERLDAAVHVENLASQRVLEKAGFLKECVHRKYYNYKGRTVDVAIFSFLVKFSTTVKASPISVLYPKNNNKVVRVMDQIHDQISLRPFELTDVDDIMLWATDKQLLQIGNKGIYTSKENALEDIKKNIIPHPWYRAICLKNQPIGKIFVDAYPGNDRFRAEVFYVVAYKHWGKGIATTALKMVLDTIFKDLPHLERLGAIVDADNLGSVRVLEKAGFLKEGVLRKFCIHKGRIVDTASFSFLSTDFKPQLD